MKVLISGFEPFDGMQFNPSQALMSSLKSEEFSFELETIVLPVSFNSCFEILKLKMNEFKPDIIIGTGLASSRREITIERIAINTIEARIADNDGNQPVQNYILEESSDGLFSQLPIHAMVLNGLKDNLPVAISNTAGTYVCNYLMYMIVNYAKNYNLKGGFIYLPPSKEINQDGLEMTLITKAVAKMLKAIEGPELTNVQLGRED